MMDRWNIRSRAYDLLEGSDLRRGPAKSALFDRARGRTMLVTAGTGLDFFHLPAIDVVAIDFSLAMLGRARARRHRSRASIALLAADAESLPFDSGSFDTAICSCSLCSIRDPDRALAEMRRVLRPGARLLLFEHVRSGQPLLGMILDAMTLWTRRGGTDMNRDTVSAIERAGFAITSIQPVFLDIILAIEAERRT